MPSPGFRGTATWPLRMGGSGSASSSSRSGLGGYMYSTFVTFTLPPPTVRARRAGGLRYLNSENSISWAVRNSRRAGTPSWVFRIARRMAGMISAGCVTRSPYPPKARAISA